MPQTSPWAGVPYNPDVTLADVARQGSPWAPMQSPMPEMPTPQMPNVSVQKPVMDLHANLPPVFAPTPKPNPQDEITGHLQSKLEGDYAKDANPFGSPTNHPGFFGKLAHGLSVATGGDTRRGWEEQGIAKQLNDVVGQKSANDFRTAETGKTNEETQEMPQKASDTHAQSGATTANLESETKARDNPRDTNPDMATYRSLTGMGMSPREALQEIEKDKALALKAPGLHYETTVNQKTGKPETYGLDESGNKAVDVGEHYEKPTQVNVNAGVSALDRETSRFAKPYEKGVSDANTQLEKIADARAMVNGNAESQALGMPKVLTALVSGAGSGVRITQPELNSIASARGLAGDVQGTLNSWAGKGKLTPTQQQQLTGILDDVKARIEAKQSIHSNALDTINSAPTREAAIAADKDARQKITALEKGGSHNSGPKPGDVEGGYKFKGGDPSKPENWMKQ